MGVFDELDLISKDAKEICVRDGEELRYGCIIEVIRQLFTHFESGLNYRRDAVPSDEVEFCYTGAGVDVDATYCVIMKRLREIGETLLRKHLIRSYTVKDAVSIYEPGGATFLIDYMDDIYIIIKMDYDRVKSCKFLCDITVSAKCLDIVEEVVRDKVVRILTDKKSTQFIKDVYDVCAIIKSIKFNQERVIDAINGFRSWKSIPSARAFSKRVIPLLGSMRVVDCITGEDMCTPSPGEVTGVVYSFLDKVNDSK